MLVLAPRPSVVEKSVHGVQAALPVIGLKVFCGQAMHVEPSSPEYPALHLQSVRLNEASAETAKLGHGSHSMSTSSKNVSDGHAVHVLLSFRMTPRYPGLQVHWVIDVAPSGASEFAGQDPDMIGASVTSITVSANVVVFCRVS